VSTEKDKETEASGTSGGLVRVQRLSERVVAKERTRTDSSSGLKIGQDLVVSTVWNSQWKGKGVKDKD